jgi:hypothetical protein
MIKFYERLPKNCDCRQLLDMLPRHLIEMMTVGEEQGGIDGVVDWKQGTHYIKHETRRYVCLKIGHDPGQIMLPADPVHREVFDNLQLILEAEMKDDFKTTMGVGFFIDNRHRADKYQWMYGRDDIMSASAGETRYIIGSDITAPGMGKTLVIVVKRPLADEIVVDEVANMRPYWWRD